MRQVLFVVHPGSCCGSLQDAVGRRQAGLMRAGLIDEIKGWRGPVVVMDGFLSDELPSYPALNRALISGVEHEGSLRFFGCDAEGPHFTDVIPTVVPSAFPDTTEVEFVVTGAWHFPSGKAGCVNGTAKALQRLGYQCRISPHAVPDPDDAPRVVNAPGVTAHTPSPGLTLKS